jgi:hypothetical protein
MIQDISTTVMGSLSDVAKQSGLSIAETFIGADVVIIVDESGSMGARDTRGGKSRHEVALEELAKLQSTLPGKIAVIAFSSNVVFVPGGQPILLGGGTDLEGALRFAKVADVADMRFIIISDGEPDYEDGALRVAATFEGRIDTIFVGPEHEHLSRHFLTKLANANGGKSTTAAQASDLAKAAQLLLSSGG